MKEKDTNEKLRKNLMMKMIEIKKKWETQF